MKFFETFHWFFNRREKKYWTGNIVLWTFLFFFYFINNTHSNLPYSCECWILHYERDLTQETHNPLFNTLNLLFLFHHPISIHSHYFHSNISFLFLETRNNSHWSLFFVTSFTNSYSISTFKSINTSISPLTCIFTPLFRIKNEKW